VGEGRGTVSIPDVVVRIFDWPASSGRTMAKELIRNLSELSNNGTSRWVRVAETYG